MNNRKPVIGLIVSLFLHILIILGLFSSHRSDSVDSQLWSGGNGVTLSYIHLSISETAGQDKVDTSENNIQKNDKSNSTHTVKTSQPIKKNESQKKGSGTINYGVGYSDTPAGGIGEGTDKNGVISNSPPSILAKIRKRILRNKVFPKLAKQNNQTGQVKVQFQIQENGQVDQLRVIKGSGHTILDDAALKTIKRSQPLPYVPTEIALTLEYRLLN